MTEASASTVHQSNETEAPFTAKDFLDRGKKILDAMSSSWTATYTGDVGLSDFQEAMKLAGCDDYILNEGGGTPTASSPPSLECAEIYFQQGRSYHKLKRWAEGLAAYNAALKHSEAQTGRYHHKVAAAYLNMGKIYESMGDSTWLALSMYRAGARIERRLYGDYGPWNSKSYLVQNSAGDDTNWDGFIRSFDLEAAGDEHAVHGEMDTAAQYYRAAALEEVKGGFGSAKNANLVLLKRKILLPGKDAFDCATNKCACKDITKGDTLYLEGHWSDAIKAYESALTTCGTDAVAGRLERECTGAAAWSGCFLPLLFVVAAIGFFMRKKLVAILRQNESKWANLLKEKGETLFVRNHLDSSIDSLVCSADPKATPEVEISFEKDRSTPDLKVDDSLLLSARPEIAADGSNGDLLDNEVDSNDGTHNDNGLTRSDPIPGKDLMDSCCESLGAAMARRQDDGPMDWSFQPKSGEYDSMSDSLSATLFGK